MLHEDVAANVKKCKRHKRISNGVLQSEPVNGRTYCEIKT